MNYSIIYRSLSIISITCLTGAGVGVGTGLWLGKVLESEIKNEK